MGNIGAYLKIERKVTISIEREARRYGELRNDS